MWNFSADIHVHSNLKPYSYAYPAAPAKRLWDNIQNYCAGSTSSTLDLISADIPRHSQASMQQAALGSVKIIGLSLFTYESGWTQNGGSSQRLMSCLTGMSATKINDIHDGRVDIYSDIWNELQFVKEQIGSSYTVNGRSFRLQWLTGSKLREWQADMQHGRIPSVENDAVIYLFLSIEGIQSLGIPSRESGADLSTYEVNILISRISDMRSDPNWGPLPVYLTFCHHFGNGLAGHARTIPAPLYEIYKRKHNFYRNKPLSDGAKAILRHCMGHATKPIIIDIKHFSALSRLAYYQLYDQEGWQLPIICSHTGIGNEHHSLIQISNDPDQAEDMRNSWLLNWSVNLCKQDIQRIHQSGGLIGIQLDLKRLAGKNYRDLVKSRIRRNQVEALKMLSCEVIWANIFTAIAAINHASAWDMICIGSDYDGIVSYLPGYKTLADYTELKADMREALEHFSFECMDEIYAYGIQLDSIHLQRLMFGMSAEQLVDKIFSTNSIRFLAQWMP